MKTYKKKPMVPMIPGRNVKKDTALSGSFFSGLPIVL